MYEAKSEMDANAVLLVLVGGKSFFDAAQRLGVSELKLRGWVREAKKAMRYDNLFLDVLVELSELQKENRQLLVECKELLSERKTLRNERALLTKWRSRDTTEKE